MDRTPGQRQFVDGARHAEYYQGKYRMTDEELAEFIHTRTRDSGRFPASNRLRVRPADAAPLVRDIWRLGENVA
jgi:alpha-D-ribose 1-methylphosphonate 5-triphosphate diphosphatase